MDIKLIQPNSLLTGLVDTFWMLHNPSDAAKEVVVLPDGNIDLIFSQADNESFFIILLGLTTQPDKVIIAARSITFAISFKLLISEYLFSEIIPHILDSGMYMPAGMWDLNAGDLNDFSAFVDKVSIRILELTKGAIDNRKKELFDRVYASAGSVTVKELSEKVFWSSRQMNRYFTKQFGVTLKTYCNILRFRASFQHIKEGKLFPEQDFFDQPHFIREVKKLAGVSPKELKRNQNDRFIQFYSLPEQ